MKRILPILLFLVSAASLQGQVVNLTDVMSSRQSKVVVTVLDSLSREPLGFASVYLVPEKDTVITNFSLTDSTGRAILDEVPYGAYSFHVEMLGYGPRRMRTYLRNENVDMGTLLMVLDPNYLEAAVVSDVGNPMIVKKDTLIFNASSFRTNANAMLKDLLLKLPGVEITSDGRVKINGQLVDKVTVGGRTFFFDDQSMALNNLPASIVERISFIDRDSMEKRATGVERGPKEKVMDVTLKKEYQDGWFGNVTLRGGTSAGKADDQLRDYRKFLFKSNALLAAYSEKDQVTVVGNGVNVTDDDMLTLVDDGEGIYSSAPIEGLVTVGQIGVNVNTSRIKNVESSAMVNYRHSGLQSGSRTSRTTFLADGELLTASENAGQEYANQYTGKAEFRKENGKVWFNIIPNFQYRAGHRTMLEESTTSRDGAPLTSQDVFSAVQFSDKKAHLDADVILQDLFGKAGRNLWIATKWNYYQGNGDREESTSSLMSSVHVDPLLYVKRGTNRLMAIDATYSEPLGEKWLLSLMAGFQANGWKDGQNVSRQTVRDDILSYQSDLLSLQQRYEGSAQYTFSEDHSVRVGLRAIGIKDSVNPSSQSVPIGGQWHWFLAPAMGYNWYKDNSNLRVEMLNYTLKPDRKWFAPAPDISVPNRIQVGNTWLRSGYNSVLQARFSHSNSKAHTSLSAWTGVRLNMSPAVMAQWTDANGITYSVPVNAAKPTFQIDPSVRYSFRLGKKRGWSMSTGVGGEYTRSSSYYSSTERTGIDISSFQYASFMKDFWGNDQGDRFYSGESGFRENTTRWLDLYGRALIKYNGNRFSSTLMYTYSLQKAWYSLFPNVRNNTHAHSLAFGADYTTRHEFELSTELSYTRYYGYAAGFGLPEWIWDMEISKNIGPFNLSIQAHDLLDQTRNLSRSAHGNYEETSYRLVMGRYILFGVRWNFGKMNSVHSSRAEIAAVEMSM